MIDAPRWWVEACCLLVGAVVLTACDGPTPPSSEDDDDSAFERPDDDDITSAGLHWRAVNLGVFGAGVTTAGQVLFWGALPEGSPSDDPAPTLPPRDPAGRFDLVLARSFYWCGIREDRVVRCGEDFYLPWAPIGDEKVLDLSVGWNDACAVLDDGTLSCWSHLYLYDPPEPPSGNEWSRVAVAGGGESAAGCSLTRGGTLVCWGPGELAQEPTPPGRFVDLSIHRRWGCAIDDDSHIRCWGREDSVYAPPEGEFEQVSVGAKSACALTVEGEVRCWGDNHHFLTDEQPDLPGPVEPPPGRFVQVSTGPGYACGVREDRTLTCWGSTDSGAQIPPE